MNRARFARKRNEIRLRGHSYDAFLVTPQVRGITPFAYCEMKTDGVGNVIDMPLDVPECFGDAVTRHRWYKALPIRSVSSRRKPWLQTKIYARCVTCKATQGCVSLGRERVNSDPVLKTAFDDWQANDRRGGIQTYAVFWSTYVETLAARWCWSTLEIERTAHRQRTVEVAKCARRVLDALRKKTKRAASRAPSIDPLAMSDPALQADRQARYRAILLLINTPPSSPTWKRMSGDDAERISWTWYARELMYRAGVTKPTPGKLAPLICSLTFTHKTGEALRARIRSDLLLIAKLVTP